MLGQTRRAQTQVEQEKQGFEMMNSKFFFFRVKHLSGSDPKAALVEVMSEKTVFTL